MTNEADPKNRSGDYSNWRSRVPFESFEGTASFLKIPQESWANLDVRKFVDLVNRVRKLQMDLTIADSENSFGRALNDPESSRRYKDINQGLNPSLSDRYMSAELLMRVAIQILEEGFNGNIAHPNYIQGKLNPAIGRYGLEVRKRDK